MNTKDMKNNCYKLWLLTISALLLSACVSTSSNVVKTSPNDNKAYRFLELDNGMRALLISDPNSNKAAASIDVFVGSADNPENRQGLAHYLEHMLFLGTKKYPKVDEYKQYIDQYGGGYNAYTALRHTNYYFDIEANYLYPALDRFAQFFIHPLFNPEYVVREREVVNSEYLGGLRSDGRRNLDAYRQIVNPKAAMSQFSVGTNETLADDERGNIRDELIRFYKEHYSSEKMVLVVLAKEDLDTIESRVKPLFSEVPRSESSTPNRVSELNQQQLEAKFPPLFDSGTLPKMIVVEPIRTRRNLILQFPQPPVIDKYRAKPVQYIGHLLGHEGTGSLLAYLKSQGWAKGLSAGIGYEDPTQSMLNVAISLTESGQANLDNIIEAVFSYVELIKQSGVKQEVFDENKRLASIDFKYPEESNAINYVSGLANLIHRYPVKDLIYSAYAWEQYSPQLLHQFLRRLNPDNMVVSIEAPGVKADRLTEFYKTPYSIQTITESRLEKWRNPSVIAELELPGPNPFIPEELSLIAGLDETSLSSNRAPKKVLTREGMAFWHLSDGDFGLPNAAVYFSVRSTKAANTPLNYVLTELMVDVIIERLNQISYDAHLAGLSYNLYQHPRGITIKVSGYNDKQKVLLARILAAIKTPEIDPVHFETVFNHLEDKLNNAQHAAPYKRGFNILSTNIVRGTWSIEQKKNALEQVELGLVEQHLATFFEEINIVGLSHGNVTKEEGITMADMVSDSLLQGSEIVLVVPASAVKFRPGDEFVIDVDSSHKESALLSYFQGSNTTIRDQAYMSLLLQLVATPFFQELRTEQKLGYHVFATSYKIRDLGGIVFVVQSALKSTDQLNQSVVRFIKDYKVTLDNMDLDTFNSQKASLLGRILEKENRLLERSGRFWIELDREIYQFDLRQQLANELQAIKLDDIKSFYEATLLANDRRNLVVKVIGGDDNNHGGIATADQVIQNNWLKQNR